MEGDFSIVLAIVNDLPWEMTIAVEEKTVLKDVKKCNENSGFPVRLVNHHHF